MTGRMDLEQSFLSLSSEVNSLRQLSYIAEELATQCLCQSKLNCAIPDLQAQGYTVAVMTSDQYNAIAFLITHIGDIARDAVTSFEAVEELALTYRRVVE